MKGIDHAKVLLQRANMMLLKTLIQSNINILRCKAKQLVIWQMAFWYFWIMPTAINAQHGPQSRLPTIELSAHMYVIQAEVAQTAQEQSQGLMYRQSMGDHEGMLFIYDRLEIRCFWMRNTLIPLTIAFLSDDGTIVNMRDMEPKTEKPHCSTRPVRFALEMNQGWFNKRSMQPGFRIQGLPNRIPID